MKLGREKHYAWAIGRGGYFICHMMCENAALTSKCCSWFLFMSFTPGLTFLLLHDFFIFEVMKDLNAVRFRKPSSNKIPHLGFDTINLYLVAIIILLSSTVICKICAIDFPLLCFDFFFRVMMCYNCCKYLFVT